MEPTKVKLTLKDCIFIFSQLAEQLDTAMFMGLVNTAVTVHCETHNVSKEEFFKDACDIAKLMEEFMNVNDAE